MLSTAKVCIECERTSAQTSAPPSIAKFLIAPQASAFISSTLSFKRLMRIPTIFLDCNALLVPASALLNICEVAAVAHSLSSAESEES